MSRVFSGTYDSPFFIIFEHSQECKCRITPTKGGVYILFISKITIPLIYVLFQMKTGNFLIQSSSWVILTRIRIICNSRFLILNKIFTIFLFTKILVYNMNYWFYWFFLNGVKIKNFLKYFLNVFRPPKIFPKTENRIESTSNKKIMVKIFHHFDNHNNFNLSSNPHHNWFYSTGSNSFALHIK